MNRYSQTTPGAFTAQALLAWGIEDVAYVRPTEADGKAAFAICTADGSEIAVFDDRDVAFAACRQHELEPLSVH